MNMVVHVPLVPCMGMIVRSVFTCVIVVVELFHRAMLVLVHMLMTVGVAMFVGMGFIPMGVDMRMGMRMLVGMKMAMFMIAFHYTSLLSF